ncbi:FecR domain-containing protein, partial [Chloroflexota bacterium]
MKTDLANILDDCIEQIRNGQTIEACLAKYPDVREELEPLLDLSCSIRSLPTIVPSNEFIRVSKARLMARIAQEPSQAKAMKSGQGRAFFNRIALSWQRLWHANTVVRKISVPVTVVLLLVLVASLSGTLSLLSPQPTLASRCTLSILSGDVEVQNPGADIWQQGTDGMALTVGTRVKTASHTHALLTFFEGSTIKLEPGTDVEIQQVEHVDEQSTVIVLKQWLGRTWSRVVKMADSGSHYRIETPSATAVVRGTLFTTEVEETGFTRVATTEGLVSVVAHDEEVYVPASKQTRVETGTVPTQPVAVPVPMSEIIITVDMPAVGSVSDPTGSSTGILPSGLSFNQITGSQLLSPSNVSQIVTIAEPMAGEYTVNLRYIAEGTAHFSIQGKAEDKVVFGYVGNWDAKEGDGRMIRLSLYVEAGVIVGGKVTSAELLGDKMPEKVVEPKLAGKGAGDKDTGGKEDVGKGAGDKDTGGKEDVGKG